MTGRSEGKRGWEEGEGRRKEGLRKKGRRYKRKAADPIAIN